MNPWPRVNIFSSGVIPAVSPKSYSYRPFVREGIVSGSTATKRVSSRPARRSRIAGNVNPAKFEPPPTDPTITSGVSSASSSCLRVSWPITVWCIRTWFRTLPREYFVPCPVTAASRASEIAMPRDPGPWPLFSRRLRPYAVRSLGEGNTSAPKSCMRTRRYGFWS